MRGQPGQHMVTQDFIVSVPGTVMANVPFRKPKNPKDFLMGVEASPGGPGGHVFRAWLDTRASRTSSDTAASPGRNALGPRRANVRRVYLYGR